MNTILRIRSVSAAPIWDRHQPDGWGWDTVHPPVVVPEPYQAGGTAGDKVFVVTGGISGRVKCGYPIGYLTHPFEAGL